MTRVGIIGLGFMGKMHFRCYRALKDVNLAAICDTDKDKFKSTSGTAGNIAGAEKPLDFEGVGLYTDFKKMLAESNLDAVSVTLPTYLHAQYTIKALEAGLHVMCEKPMALNSKDCQRMVAAAKRTGRILQIGHCIRFWPEYAFTKQLIDSGRYGKVLSATFQRLSLTPTWSWKNWILAGKKSGGATLDLHIHDSDYVQYAFGMPKEVFSRAVKGTGKDFDYIITNYIYPDKVVTAEGGWMMAAGFGFEMSFNIALQKATLVFDCTKTPAFKICQSKGKVIIPKLQPGDGYSLELAHFAKAAAGEKVPQIITPVESMSSVKLIEAEKKSARSGKQISIA